MPASRNSIDPTAILQGYTEPEQKPQIRGEEQELLTDLEDRFQGAYEARIPYERDWEMYRLYLKGEQLIIRHKDSGEVVRVTSEDSKRLRSVLNILRPTARSLIGKLTRSIPTCTAIPATADFNEQHGAKVAEALLQYARRKENLDLKYLEANEYLPWAGNAILQLAWNKLGGRKLAFCPVCGFNDSDQDMINAPCPACRNQRKMELATQKMEHETAKAMAMLGGVQHEAVLNQGADQAVQQAESSGLPIEDVAGSMDVPQAPPGPDSIPLPPMKQGGPLPLEKEPGPLVEAFEGDFEVYVRDVRGFYIEPGCVSIKQANWCCYREALPVPEVRRMFPECAEWIAADPSIHTDRTAELRYNALVVSGIQTQLRDHCYVREYHERPTEAYPKGRIIYVVGDRIARIDNESPYNILGRFPFYHMGFDKSIGEFWHEPFIAQAWHRQRELNNIETQIREHTELALKPKMLNPMGSRISQDEITANSDQIIKYNANAGMPTFLVWPQLAQQVFERKAELTGDIRLQATITGPEMGEAGSDPNGRAMAIIEAEADQQLGPILLRNHNEWREMHLGILKLFKQYAHPDRKWSIAGPEGVEIYSFDELILSDGFDLQIEQEDGLSRNPSIRLQQAADLANLPIGLFVDPMTGIPDKKSFIRFAKLKMPQGGYDIEATERSAAAQIPKLIQQGIMRPPQIEDDPMLFAEVLLGWLRGPGRKMEQQNPMVVMQVRQIWQIYAMWAMSGQMPGVMGAQTGQPMAPGGPPAAGSDMSSPGGSFNDPGHMGTVAMQAGAQVGQADAMGERSAQQATGQSKHES